MNKKLKISLSSLSKETQRRVKRELSQLKQSKRVLSNNPLSEEAKAWLDKVVKGTWTQRPDGKIDVDGDVYASGDKEIQNFLGKEIFFGEVRGGFYCEDTKITSLEGSPKEVGGIFDCSRTRITSLEGAPEKVGGIFDCSYTKITSLEGSPKEVGGDFWCYDTNITSLKGAPREVGGSFWCTHTLITSLEGAPEVVGGSFYCYYTPYEAGLKKQEQEKHEKEVSPSDRVLSNTPVSLNQLIKEVKELLKQAQEENNEEIDRVYSKYFGDCSINLSENKEILRDHEEAVNAALNKFINFLKKHGIKTVELGDSEVVDNSGLGGYGSNYDPGDTINQGFQPHTVCFEILNLPEDLIAKILSADFYKEGDEGNIIFDVRKEDNILMIDVGAASLEVEIGDEQEDEDEDEEDEDEY